VFIFTLTVSKNDFKKVEGSRLFSKNNQLLKKIKVQTRPAWAGFKTAEEGRANTPFGVGGPRG
jgi:hypothetical protein